MFTSGHSHIGTGLAKPPGDGSDHNSVEMPPRQRKSNRASAAKSAELKPLNGAPGRYMVVSSCIHEDKVASENLAQTGRVMAHDRQAAASFGTIRSERTDDDVPPGLNSHFEPIDISGLIGAIGQEMEGGPVVPQIIGLSRLPFRDVCDHPLDVGAAVAETLLGRGKGGPGKIENGEPAKLSSEQIVHQA